MRPSGRAPNELREIVLETEFSKYAEGSCLAKFGDTTQNSVSPQTFLSNEKKYSEIDRPQINIFPSNLNVSFIGQEKIHSEITGFVSEYNHSSSGSRLVRVTTKL